MTEPLVDNSNRPEGKFQATILVAVALALITFAVYWPAVYNGFVNFDDPDYITGNPRVLSGLTVENVRWAFTSYHSSNWHPLTWLSHMLDARLFGTRPAGHHLVSVLWHVINSVLLLLVLKRMTQALWPSAFVAALFAFHPLHVESVAWVSERKDVLSAFFFLLTLAAYAGYVSRLNAPAAGRQGGAWGYYTLAVLCFALGLMSKPMLVTLPFVLLLLDFWPLRRLAPDYPKVEWRRAGRLLVEKVPFFALTLASSVVTFMVQRASGAVVSLGHAPFENRLANALVSYCRYLGKTFWPVDLAAFYPYRVYGWDDWQVWGAVLLLVGVSVAVVLAARRARYSPVGWFWFLGMLVPVIGFVQVGKQAWADRYTYLPHIGLFLLLVWAVSGMVRHFKAARLPALAAAALLGVCCGVLTHRQTAVWRSSRTLFEHAARVTSGNFVAYGVLATVLVDEGKLDEALEYCQKALALSPGYPEAHNTLGAIYTRQRKFAEAQRHYELALQTDATYSESFAGLADVFNLQRRHVEAEAKAREAVRLGPLNVVAWFQLATALHHQGKLDEAEACYRRILELNPALYTPRRFLGNLLAAQGRTDQAIAQYQDALRIQPADADTRTVLGAVLLEQGRIEEAAAQLAEAVRLAPTNALANYQLAIVQQGTGKLPEAIASYRAALESQPAWPEALNNLAWLLASSAEATLRHGAEAVRLAEKACTLTERKVPVFLGTLAAAYAEAGRFDEAVATAEEAIAKAEAAGQKEIAARNRELIELYRAGKACHQAPVPEKNPTDPLRN